MKMKNDFDNFRLNLINTGAEKGKKHKFYKNQLRNNDLNLKLILKEFRGKERWVWMIIFYILWFP